ncbi:hypothetical protein FLONG3_10243 [Fusarium longipes]|uniref:Uncharacterized protein n=1 Tax=Fusarium longipes TaxID=694270 RepID=A0A395RQP8_9HYPO|nr:hypothetical protein FLONG3_10243 [Fusarium longipes]
MGFGCINLTPTASSESSRRVSLMEKWNDYFQRGTIHDFRRLCVDLDLPGDLPSKTKCRAAIKTVHVNINQFLDCDNKPDDVRFFKSRSALIRWTKKKKAFFPRRNLPKGSPLRTLLERMSY